MFGLKLKHLKAGTEAANLECCKVMEKNGLFNRFAVYVDKQRRKNFDEVDPKSYSKGWVACFEENAAQVAVTLLRNRSEDDPIFPNCNDWYFNKWRRKGIPDMTLKDLRRASLYYLGHHTNLGLTPLMNHARHKRVETTRLYLRRPDEFIAEDFKGLSLEA